MVNRRKWLKVGFISATAVFLIVTVMVAKIVLGPQTELRQQTILRLYDLNCSFPFKTYRYPRPIKWLVKGEQFQEEGWRMVLTCRAR